MSTPETPAGGLTPWHCEECGSDTHDTSVHADTPVRAECIHMDGCTCTPETPAGGLTDALTAEESGAVRAARKMTLLTLLMVVDTIKREATAAAVVQARAEDRARIEALRTAVDDYLDHWGGGIPPYWLDRLRAALTATEDGDRP